MGVREANNYLLLMELTKLLHVGGVINDEQADKMRVHLVERSTLHLEEQRRLARREAETARLSLTGRLHG